MPATFLIQVSKKCNFALDARREAIFEGDVLLVR